MTVKITKPQINVREELNDLKKPTGVAGEAMLRAETPQEQFNLIGAGRRNLIINGDFQINQRGNSSGVSDAGYIGVDRWRAFIGTNSTIYFTQQSFANGHSDVDRDLRHYLKFDWLGTGSAQTKILSQRLEDVQTGNGQKVTLSFWGRTEQADDCKVGLTQVFGSGGSSTVDHLSGTIDLTTDWQYFTHTFDLTSTSGKTIGTGSSLRLEFIFGPATLNSYFEVAGVQLELGNVATPFEHRSHGEELALCLRYYHKFGDNILFIGTGGNGGTFQHHPPVPMRAIPSIINTKSDPYWEDNPWLSAGTSLTGFTITTSNTHSDEYGGDIRVSGTFTPNTTRGYQHLVDANYLAADAEL